MTSLTSEQRAIVRLPCEIAISRSGQAAPMGVLADISLDGAFLATSDPLPLGTVAPIVFRLGGDGPQIRPTVEVVRISEKGAGLRFTSISKQDMRRLRRYIADLANLVSNRQAAEILAKSPDGATKPFTDAGKIRELLQNTVGKTEITLIVQNQSQRLRAKPVALSQSGLTFDLKESWDLKPGDTVLGLYSSDYTSFSFETAVLSVSSTVLAVALPTAISYSERRTSQREHAQGMTVSMALPWRRGEVATWDVHERTTQGMSFLVRPDEAYFWPGVQIPSLTIATATVSDVAEGATVKHLSAYRDAAGKEWVRIGVALPHARQVESSNEKMRHEDASENAAWRWGRGVAAKVGYLLHKAVHKVNPTSQQILPTVVQFKNTRGQKVVGLLNLTAPDQGKQRMPLVLVAPGFGARKETMSALALVVTDILRRHHKDVAVLRFDGTNSIGESYKDPGCDLDGRENMRYSVSGGVSDIVGAVRWAKSNPFVEATDVILVSVSFSSIAARHALTLPELAHVRQWICFMGAPDAQNAVMNISGNVDAYAMFLGGQKLGVTSLLGCMVDAQAFCADLRDSKVGTLEDARREMAAIKADVTWFIGKNDAFMDSARVKDIMSVQSKGKRQIVEVNAGHVPQSSEEAVSEFSMIARHIYRGLHGVDIAAAPPSMGKIGVVHQWEWARVRKTNVGTQQDYWSNYLLGGTTGLGYDVWTLTPEYRKLLADTLALAHVEGRQALEIGAGTGNMTVKLLEKNPKSLTALDLVPEALESLKKKVAGAPSVQCVAASIDGSAWTAMRRWLAGDLPGFGALLQALPAGASSQLRDVEGRYTPKIHAYLRGARVHLTRVVQDAGLGAHVVRPLQNLRLLLECVQGGVSANDIRETIDPAFVEILNSPPGLPFPDDTFDIVVGSLVLSYMSRVDDTLFELRRVLRPGGTLVVSTLVPDVDSSKAFMGAINHYQNAPDEEIPAGLSRDVVLAALREFLDRGAGLLRLQEEGQFQFWSPEAFADLLAGSTLEVLSTTPSFGEPPQAAIVVARKS